MHTSNLTLNVIEWSKLSTDELVALAVKLRLSDKTPEHALQYLNGYILGRRIIENAPTIRPPKKIRSRTKRTGVCT